MRYFSSKIHFVLFVVLCFFFLLILANTCTGLIYSCFNIQDYGIYQQGLYEVFFQGILNPERTVRNVSILGDHVNPILYLALPFIYLTNFHPLTLGIFEWTWLLAFFVLLFLEEGKQVNGRFLLFVFFTLFSKPIMTGLSFPIHPGVWSPIAWFLLFKSIKDKNTTKIIFSSLFVCLFRESFYFVIFALSFFYFLNKKWKVGGALFLISTFLIVLVFIVRPNYIQTHNFGALILKGLFVHPIDFIKWKWNSFNGESFIKLFYAFIIPLGYIFFKEAKKNREHPFWALIIGLAPLFAMHFIANINIHSNMFSFQYGTGFAAPILSVIFLSSFPDWLLKRKRLVYLMLILFFFSSSSIYTRMMKRVVLRNDSKCEIKSDKKYLTEELKLKLKSTLGTNKTLLTTGGVVPWLLYPGMKAYQIRGFSIALDHYNYMLIEKGQSSNVYPLDVKEVAQVKKDCSQFNQEILIDNKYFYFAKGDYPFSCIAKYH